MASITTSICGASSAVALSVSASAQASTTARAQLAAPSLKNRLTSKPAGWTSKTVSNGSRVNAFNVVNPNDNLKFETLSFLPQLSDEQISKQIDYLLKNGLIPAIEFDKNGTVTQTNCHMPGYYDGRYWVMWKLPLFGAKDSSQVMSEIVECKKAYPGSFARVIGFDNVRQVQIISFIVYKPGGK